MERLPAPPSRRCFAEEETGKRKSPRATGEARREHGVRFSVLWIPRRAYQHHNTITPSPTPSPPRRRVKCPGRAAALGSASLGKPAARTGSSRCAGTAQALNDLLSGWSLHGGERGDTGGSIAELPETRGSPGTPHSPRAPRAGGMADSLVGSPSAVTVRANLSLPVNDVRKKPEIAQDGLPGGSTAPSLPQPAPSPAPARRVPSSAAGYGLPLPEGNLAPAGG